MNFNFKLQNLETHFGENPINDFIKNQLAAGKKNYNEDQFFRALAEINVLNYLLLFLSAYSGQIEKIYEPKLGCNGDNPEARFILNDETIIDVEVKTPGFPLAKESLGTYKGILRPNMYLSTDQATKLKRYLKRKNIQCVMPRVRKVADLLHNTFDKFEVPDNKKHFNLLFINWTYNDMPTSLFNEIVSILSNDYTGILKNAYVRKELGISESDIKKISAIIVYCDNIESLMFGDFRMLYMNNNFRIISNIGIECHEGFEKILDILNLKGRTEFDATNKGLINSMNIIDFIPKNNTNTCFIKRVLTDSENILRSDSSILKQYNFSDKEIMDLKNMEREILATYTSLWKM